MSDQRPDGVPEWASVVDDPLKKGWCYRWTTSGEAFPWKRHRWEVVDGVVMDRREHETYMDPVDAYPVEPEPELEVLHIPVEQVRAGDRIAGRTVTPEAQGELWNSLRFDTPEATRHYSPGTVVQVIRRVTNQNQTEAADALEAGGQS